MNVNPRRTPIRYGPGDRACERILELFAATYGTANAYSWLVRWRVFFMSCAELWGYAGGNEWIVSHYLLRPRPVTLRSTELAVDATQHVS